VRVDARIVEPFNKWWRAFGRQASPPGNPTIIAAFEAGWKAGLQYGVDKATEVLNGRPEVGKLPAKGE
jgi:hypothetical protein